MTNVNSTNLRPAKLDNLITTNTKNLKPTNVKTAYTKKVET